MINVLSLFDGISAAQVALKRAGIDVDKYFASEIDKYAIKVTQHNFPNTIQLGDVTKLDTNILPPIDLLCGGSPCQSFSFAGKRKGMSTKDSIEILTLEHYLELKEKGFEFEGQSYLFWEYMRVLKEVKPKYFLLENVMMGSKWQAVLTKAIDMEPIMINAALVSAQNRKRLWWTNIGAEPDGIFEVLTCKIPQPKDKGILLKDILETEVDEKYFLSDKILKKLNYTNTNTINIGIKSKGIDVKKSHSLMARDYKGLGNQGQSMIVCHNMMPRSGDPSKGGTGHLSRTDGKTYCLDTGNTNAVEVPFCVAMGGRDEAAALTPKRTEYGKSIRKEYEAGSISEPRKNIQQLEPRDDGKTNCLTSVQKDNLIIQINPITESGGKQPYQQNRVYSDEGQSPALMAQMSSGTHAIQSNSRIRRLTPGECEKLQTFPSNYTNVVSDSQRYKSLGNSWCVDVATHIFSYLPNDYKKQTT